MVLKEEKKENEFFQHASIVPKKGNILVNFFNRPNTMDYFTKVNYSMLKHITGTKGTSHTHQHTLQTPTKERNVRSESTKFIYSMLCCT